MYTANTKTAAEIWASYTGEEQNAYLIRMAWHEYRRGDAIRNRKTGEFLPNPFSWIQPGEKADALEAIAHGAYIRIVERLADDDGDTERGGSRLARIVSRAIIQEAITTARRERRKPSALRRSKNGEEWIDTTGGAIADPIAPSPEHAAIIRDAISRAARDDIDRAIIAGLAQQYSAREIAPAVGLSHTAVNKRIKGIRGRYDAD